MVLKKFTRQLIKIFKNISKWAEYDEQKPEKEPAIAATEEKSELKNPIVEKVKTISSIWDYLKFNENTQAYHLSAVLNYDEWIDMDEIRKRIVELYGVEYKNEKSLYPYVKTLTDVGLVETVSAGGRRKWRKKSILITTEEAEPTGMLLANNKTREKKKEANA